MGTRGMIAAATTVLGVALYPRVRRGGLTCGATEEEVRATLPGDELLTVTDLVATRAVSIGAAPADVWPWLAQMGSGRGGLYSYDRLENLLGCDMHSADDVVAQWQDIRVGDLVHLHPDRALEVALVEPGRALVLRGVATTDPPRSAAEEADVRGTGGTTEPGPEVMPFDFTWAFVVTDSPERRTRLVVRERYVYRTPWAAPMVEAVSWVSLVMTERMLRGIRTRAERLAPPVATRL